MSVMAKTGIGGWERGAAPSQKVSHSNGRATFGGVRGEDSSSGPLRDKHSASSDRYNIVPFSRGGAKRQSECSESGSLISHEKALEAQIDFRDATAQLCLKTVALALCVPLDQLVSARRCKADIALARQIAMYLAHTQFSMAMTEVGLAFKRDRTTVSHACRLVEDKRDEETFDLTITQLEALLGEAVNAIEAKCGRLDGGDDV